MEPIQIPRRFPKKAFIAAAVIGIIAIASASIYIVAFGAPQNEGESKQFTMPIAADDSDGMDAAERLHAEGFTKYEWPLRLVFWMKGLSPEPGAYKLSMAMDVWELAAALEEGSYMKWIVITEGLRKEEIADILTAKLEWSDSAKQKWITKDTAVSANYTEGVYFPDTYLIPLDEEPAKVADRLRAKFNEKFAPALAEALKQNIRWPTLVKIASIVQREAAGKHDMPLVAGIFWNRLLANQRLEVDATLQYIKGAPSDWWPPISPADKQLDSPYNTYRRAGLPPLPISNPGLDAINAVLFPTETDCFFYLHDGEGKIHCAETYEGHLQNIEEYL